MYVGVEELMSVSHVTVLRWLIVSWVTAVLPAKAQSVPSPAPDMPLPPCTFVDGEWHGACPAESEYLSGSAAGRFLPGGSVMVATNPVDPACDQWSLSSGAISPLPCYSRVAAPRVVTCATIDLLDGERFRELPCNQALYLDTADLPNPLFTTRRPNGYEDWNGATTCGATPSYAVYVYGGPASNEAAVWRTRGPLALTCNITFEGLRRPDGLYGPTWAKVQVQVNRADSPDSYNGSVVWSEFYVPIDGDLRFDNIDVEVEAEGSVTDADWDNGRVLATYTATVTSRGEEEAENVQLDVNFPRHLSVQEISNDSCRLNTVTAPDYTGGTPPPGSRMNPGGNVQCNWPALDVGDSETVEIVARIVNATDLHALQTGEVSGGRPGVYFVVTADEDAVDSNNEAIVAVDIPFRSGSYSATRDAMQTLDQHFSYSTWTLLSACNTYKEEILERLDGVRAEHPHAFANLSYGGVTSGSYQIAGINHDWLTAGHVGVVVYAKGTNYRETGIIINGTPTPSPLNFSSEIGQYGSVLAPLGTTRATFATSTSGYYLLTPANRFPGFPVTEAPAMTGFEGRYVDNGHEFVIGGGTPPAPDPAAGNGLTCSFAPDAMVVATASPVEILVTNPRGQRVETEGGRIITQELDGGIHAMAFPHEDGTYGWTLVLPIDDYDVELRGIADGHYELTLMTFDETGTPIEEVTSGSTFSGQVLQYEFAGPDPISDPAPPIAVPPPAAAPPAQQSRGGRGAIDPALLAALLVLALLGRLLRQRAASAAASTRQASTSRHRP